MDKQIIKYRIMMILTAQLLDSISIDAFKEMIEVLDLEELNLDLSKAIIEDAKNKVFKIRSDSELDLLELMEEE